MKKIASLFLAAVMAVALIGCGAPGTSDGSSAKTGYPDEDGYAEGKLNDTMHTYFFDFTVNSAYVCDKYENYTPQEGKELLVAEVTIKNTHRESIPMFDTDFQVQWNDSADDAFDVPVTYYADSTDTIGKDVLPYEYTLAVNETKTGLLVFEVPTGLKDFNISYLEEFDDDSTGNVFFVYFTADRK